MSAKIVGFVLLPVYTEKLVVADYGRLAILEITAQIMITIAGLNISTAMLRWATLQPEKYREIVSTSFFAVLSLLTIFAAIFIPLRSMLAMVLFSDPKFGYYFLLLILYVLGSVYLNLPFTQLRVKERSTAYALLNTVRFTLTLALIIYFVVYRGEGIAGILRGQLYAVLLMILITLPVVLRDLRWKFDYPLFKSMIAYSLPLIFSTLSGIILAVTDRYVLRYSASFDDVGIYSLAYKFASIVNIVLLQSMQIGLLPIALRYYNEDIFPRLIMKILTYFNLLGMMLVLILSFYSRELIVLLAEKPEYYPAYKLIPLLAIPFLFRGMQYIFALNHHYRAKTRQLTLIILAGACLNLVLNLILIPRYTIWGAGTATFIATLSIMLIVLVGSQKIRRFNYRLDKQITVILTGIVLFGVSLLFGELPLVGRIAAKTGLLFIFPVLLYFLKIYEPIELLTLKNLLKPKSDTDGE
ncbi:MAG: oligosaccharide flippase family protein [Candidatus Cloacimonetes bacterium]|nr:oligosaccharide flippase family protein [Candidatus Cloacimonadota bacterium]